MAGWLRTAVQVRSTWPPLLASATNRAGAAGTVGPAGEASEGLWEDVVSFTLEPDVPRKIPMAPPPATSTTARTMTTSRPRRRGGVGSIGAGGAAPQMGASITLVGAGVAMGS